MVRVTRDSTVKQRKVRSEEKDKKKKSLLGKRSKADNSKKKSASASALETVDEINTSGGELEWDSTGDLDSPLKEEEGRTESVSINRVDILEEDLVPVMKDLNRHFDDSIIENSGLISQDTLLERNFALQVKEALEQIDEICPEKVIFRL